MKILLVFLFGITLAMSSCVKDTNQVHNQEKFTETHLEKRSGSECGPEGLCEPTIVNQIVQINVNGCSVEVVFNVTECNDPLTGDVVVYFEEDIEAISINGPNSGPCAGVGPQFIEDAYTEAIFRYIQNEYRFTAPLCSTGGFVLSSKQVKTECQKYCIGPSFPGTTNYYWSPCATVQSCCIVTQKWCRDGEGNMVQNGTPSNEEVGECEGFFEGNCHQEIYPLPKDYNPCNTSRCN